MTKRGDERRENTRTRNRQRIATKPLYPLTPRWLPQPTCTTCKGRSPPAVCTWPGTAGKTWTALSGRAWRTWGFPGERSPPPQKQCLSARKKTENTVNITFVWGVSCVSMSLPSLPVTVPINNVSSGKNYVDSNCPICSSPHLLIYLYWQLSTLSPSTLYVLDLVHSFTKLSVYQLPFLLYLHYRRQLVGKQTVKLKPKGYCSY